MTDLIFTHYSYYLTNLDYHLIKLIMVNNVLKRLLTNKKNCNALVLIKLFLWIVICQLWMDFKLAKNYTNNSKKEIYYQQLSLPVLLM